MIWVDQDKFDDTVRAVTRAVNDGMREANSGLKLKFDVDNDQVRAAVFGAMTVLTKNAVLEEGTCLVTGFGNNSPMLTWPADGGAAYRARKAI